MKKDQENAAIRNLHMIMATIVASMNLIASQFPSVLQNIPNKGSNINPISIVTYFRIIDEVGHLASNSSRICLGDF